MSKVKILIELEDDVYRRIKYNPQIFTHAIDIAIQNGTPIPEKCSYLFHITENATNGKVLLGVFPPSVYYGDDEKHFALLTKDCELTCYNNEWWNAPYERITDAK